MIGCSDPLSFNNPGKYYFSEVVTTISVGSDRSLRNNLTPSGPAWILRVIVASRRAAWRPLLLETYGIN